MRFDAGWHLGWLNTCLRLEEIMVPTRSDQCGAIVRARRRWDRDLPKKGWALALPLLVVALAGCGAALDGSTSGPEGVTLTAPAESLIQQTVRSCRLDSSTRSPYAVLGDGGYTITLIGEPEDPYWVNITKVTGLTIRDMTCVLTALSVPDSIVSQIDATRALDGMQRASWNRFSASWTYHPDHGLRIILTEAK
jgi:hypothetical protein